ncbi:MAG: ribose-phosphate diphosphokinase [Novosphingobium sp.]|nr:ribose-phosphate diphosphokinase [Novosphingobium sp.]
MDSALFGFPECSGAATRLAGALDIPVHEVAVRRFPDGESLVRVENATPTAILYRSLDDPNAKLVELLLAAAALRDNGAARVILVAPYLAYMRQDIAFHPGEAVSQKVIGALLARHFDAVVTVDPHLHRIHSLGQVMPGIAAVALSAAPALSAALDDTAAPVVVGPDSESRQWVEAIATPLGLDVLVGAKHRRGDREVSIAIDGIGEVAGRKAVLVDDVIASGATLIEAAQLLRDAGAIAVEALATHCLASADDLARMKAAGITRVRSTDSVAGPTATIPLAPLLAAAIRNEGLIA